MNKNFEYLILVLLGILICASLIGFILSKKVDNDSPKRATIDNLNARINPWWLMILVLGTAFYLGTVTTLVLFGILSFLAFREFVTLTPMKPGDHRALAISFFVIVPVQYWLIGAEWYGFFVIFIPVYCFLLLPVFSAVKEDIDNFLARIAKAQFGVMITIYCISYAPALLLLELENFPKSNNIILLFFFLFVVQISDVLQYVFGKLFGKRKIAPVVSPSKTVEGFIGGGISATLVGGSLYWVTPFSFLQALGFSAIIVVMGFCGGLVLSAAKRSLEAKDWGNLIEGHGGIMDRLDSVAFSAPIFFHLVRYFFSAN